MVGSEPPFEQRIREEMDIRGEMDSLGKLTSYWTLLRQSCYVSEDGVRGTYERLLCGDRSVPGNGFNTDDAKMVTFWNIGAQLKYAGLIRFCQSRDELKLGLTTSIALTNGEYKICIIAH